MKLSTLFLLIITMGSYSQPIITKHIERESKISFRYKKGLDIGKVVSEIHAKINQRLNKINHFPALFGKHYKIDQQVTTLIFKDQYFDINDSLYKRNEIFRLRHRWKSYRDYLMFNFFPFLKLFRPIRAEIQHKAYQDITSNFLTSIEKRIEYGNGEHDEHCPWNQDFLLSQAKQSFTQLNLANHNKVCELLTIRHRFHLNLKNVWGSGLNPEHVFIISIDDVQCLTSGEKSCLIEIEVEIERNVSREIDNALVYISKNEISEQAINFAKKSITMLRKDQSLITSLIKEIFHNKKIKLLKPRPKAFRVYFDKSNRN